MKNHFSTIFRVLILGLAFGMTGCPLDLPGCGTNAATAPDANATCGTMEHVFAFKTLYTTSEYFSVSTPDANKDCEASWYVHFYWADSSRRVTSTILPEIELYQVFTDGVFGYFPSPAPVTQISFDGGHFGFITFSAADKNVGYPSVNYAFYTQKKSTNPADSVGVTCTIEYYPAKK